MYRKLSKNVLCREHNCTIAFEGLGPYLDNIFKYQEICGGFLRVIW